MLNKRLPVKAKSNKRCDPVEFLCDVEMMYLFLLDLWSFTWMSDVCLSLAWSWICLVFKGEKVWTSSFLCSLFQSGLVSFQASCVLYYAGAKLQNIWILTAPLKILFVFGTEYVVLRRWWGGILCAVCFFKVRKVRRGGWMTQWYQDDRTENLEGGS